MTASRGLDALYLDSSLIVSLVIGEAKRTEAFREYDQKGVSIQSSFLTRVELQSAIGFLPPQARPLADKGWTEFSSRVNFVEVSQDILSDSSLLVRAYRSSHGLRSLDAIHVATARKLVELIPLLVLTADRRQYEVMAALGLRCRLVE